jgi:hypothetical protein
MTATHTSPTRAAYLDEASRWNVGAGILTMALAPFALPGIVLVLVLALPLLAVGVVMALLAGLVVVPLRVGRALAARRHRAEKPPAPRPEPVPTPRWQLRHREETP